MFRLTQNTAVSCRNLNSCGSNDELQRKNMPTTANTNFKGKYVRRKFPKNSSKNILCVTEKPVNGLSVKTTRTDSVRLSAVNKDSVHVASAAPEPISIDSDIQDAECSADILSKLGQTTPVVQNFTDEAIESKSVNLDTVQALVLGGGSAPAGHSMEPLTRRRAKPAIPFGGRYRLVDIPLSNLIRSGLTKNFVITQFNSRSLNEHIIEAFPTPSFTRNAPSVELLATHQSNERKEWAKGSADAIRQWLPILQSGELALDPYHSSIEDYLILSGEHVYRMDYSKLVRSHRQSGADITISAVPVTEDNEALRGVDGSGLGLMAIQGQQGGQVVHFAEKPRGSELQQFKDVSFGSTEAKPYVASMGLYIFKAEALHKLLLEEGKDTLMDIGSDVIPHALHHGYKVHGYVFDGEWEDVSTLRKFHAANLALARPSASDVSALFSAEEGDRCQATLTSSRMLPPSKLLGECEIEDALISDGCWVENSTIRNSVLGMCTKVNNNCLIENTVIMGSDCAVNEADNAIGEIPIGIGANSVIKNAVIDKSARIGEGVKILNRNGIVEGGCDDRFCIRSGLVVVLRDAILPNGMVI